MLRKYPFMRTARWVHRGLHHQPTRPMPSSALCGVRALSSGAAEMGTNTSAIPKVDDNKVNIVIYAEATGERHQLSGTVGQNLVEVCRFVALN